MFGSFLASHLCRCTWANTLHKGRVKGFSLKSLLCLMTSDSKMQLWNIQFFGLNYLQIFFSLEKVIIPMKGNKVIYLYYNVNQFIRIFFLIFTLYWSAIGGSDGKELACDVGDLGSIPGLGRSPEEGNGYPLQYCCLENSMDRGAWQATVHGVTKSQTWLSKFHFTSSFQVYSKVIQLSAFSLKKKIIYFWLSWVLIASWAFL